MPWERQKPVCQLRINLLYIEPEIWRRFQVCSDITLDRLHQVIQVVMGWENYHLHQFTVRGENYGVPPEDPPQIGPPTNDERKTSLGDVSTGGDTFTYRYDFGDSWGHEIEVESSIDPHETEKTPVCIDGERACPPEDCGGVMGYENLLEILRDPEHPEHDRMMEWVGGSFDPEEFDVDEVNERLKILRE